MIPAQVPVSLSEERGALDGVQGERVSVSDDVSFEAIDVHIALESEATTERQSNRRAIRRPDQRDDASDADLLEGIAHASQARLV
jgi:hypothetical protein